MPKPSELLVWINNDGSARELTDADKKHVDAEFSPFDGARPHVKSTYPPVNPRPPQTPQAVAGQIVELIRKHAEPES